MTRIGCARERLHQAKIAVLVVRGEDATRLRDFLDSTMSAQGSNVTIETSLGAFTVELYWDHTPKVRQHACKCTTTETTTDVQELRRAGQERLLQWRHLSSNHSSMYSALLPLVTGLIRWARLQDFMIQVRLRICIWWRVFSHLIYRVETLLGQAEVERASTVRNCKNHSLQPTR